jgi:hypothetical protein
MQIAIDRAKWRTKTDTDVIAVKHGQAEFPWGAGADLVAEGRARPPIWLRGERSMRTRTTSSRFLNLRDHDSPNSIERPDCL